MLEFLAREVVEAQEMPDLHLHAAARFARNAFKSLRDKLDPSKSNGSVVLGLNGIVIKSHGGTDADGFAYAVDVGYEMVHYDLLTKINQMLNRDGSTLSTAPTAQEAFS